MANPTYTQPPDWTCSRDEPLHAFDIGHEHFAGGLIDGQAPRSAAGAEARDLHVLRHSQRGGLETTSPNVTVQKTASVAEISLLVVLIGRSSRRRDQTFALWWPFSPLSLRRPWFWTAGDRDRRGLVDHSAVLRGERRRHRQFARAEIAVGR